MPTRRGDYHVPHYQLWADRDEIPRGAGVLEPGARVVIIGSCIAWQAHRYLRLRGYRPFHSPGGYTYNSQSVRTELERVLEERPWPLPVAMEIPGGGGFTHPFRKNLVTDTRPEMVMRDEQVSRDFRRALVEADVILCVVGTTIEAWRSEHGGVAINEIPHPDVYALGGWRMTLGDLEEIRADVREIRRLLSLHTTGSQVYAVCPIPLHATWSDESIVTRNGRGKALLRTALDLELSEQETYLPLWDWMQAQTRRWTPTRPDGRHLDWGGTDRLMHFAERYLAAGPVPKLSLRHRLRSGLRDAGYRVGLPV
jgi:hypothetical protein